MINFHSIFSLVLLLFLCRVVDFLLTADRPVTLALDGWTNAAHNKVTNLLLLTGGRSFYWKSVVNDLNHNTAGTKSFYSHPTHTRSNYFR